MQVIGFHPSSFTFDDGRTSDGITMYLSQEITDPQGAGVKTERVYLSNQKLAGYIPCIGDEIIIDRTPSGSARGVVCLCTARGK